MRIFISHRKADEKLAQALRDALVDWGVRGSSIFLARQYDRKGFMPGQNIADGLMEQLRETDLFILIYTQDKIDYSWCMWELGIATGSSTKETRNVVFTFFDEQPAQTDGDLMVKATDLDQLKGFIYNLIREPGFAVPDAGSRAELLEFQDDRKTWTDERITSKAAELLETFADLSVAIAQDSLGVENHRLRYLKLLLSGADVQRIVALRKEAVTAGSSGDQEGRDALRREAKDIVLGNAIVMQGDGNTENGALREFGISGNTAELHLDDLFESWCTDVADHDEVDALADELTEWQTALLEDISRATEGRVSKPLPYFMRRIEDRSYWLQPIVARTTSFPDQSIEFDIYLVKIFRLGEGPEG